MAPFIGFGWGGGTLELCHNVNRFPYDDQWFARIQENASSPNLTNNQKVWGEIRSLQETMNQKLRMILKFFSCCS
jgi:hypothetical protein